MASRPGTKAFIFLSTLVLLSAAIGWLWLSSGDVDRGGEPDGRSQSAIGLASLRTGAGLPAAALAMMATAEARDNLPPLMPEELQAIAATAAAPTETTEGVVSLGATPEPPTVAAATPSIEPPVHAAVNGVPYESIIFMPDNVVARAEEIWVLGQQMGRNPAAYAKVGDSTTEPPHFMTRFDTGPYELGDYAFLQPAIGHFAGSHDRDSLAGRVGMHSWSAVDPAWADKSICQPNETPVSCEIRVHNPAILLIRLGTNDVGVPEMFDSSLRQIVETAINAGVIPVIGTKADRHEGSDQNNQILRQIHYDYQLPLWDFDMVAATLPGRGLDVDAAHMNTYFAHDYRDPTAFTRGHAMHNLTALMVLDAIWREVLAGG